MRLIVPINFGKVPTKRAQQREEKWKGKPWVTKEIKEYYKYYKSNALIFIVHIGWHKTRE